MAVELNQMFWVFLLEILYSEKGKTSDLTCYVMEFLEFIFIEAFFLPDSIFGWFFL